MPQLTSHHAGFLYGDIRARGSLGGSIHGGAIAAAGAITQDGVPMCRHGKKLDYARTTALLYTVGLVFDKTSISQTSVPSGTR